MKYEEVTCRTKEYTARIEKLCIRHNLDSLMAMQNMVLEEWHDRALDQMVLQMTRRLAAGDTTEEAHSIQYPMNWWQHCKQRWSPTWALKRWPVQMTTVTLPAKVTRMCPHVELRDNLPHLRWLAYEPEPMRYSANVADQPRAKRVG